MNDYQVHFRFHDGIDAFAGIERWRYEVIRRSDVETYARHLGAKGYDQMSWRRLRSTESWQNVDHWALSPHN